MTFTRPLLALILVLAATSINALTVTVDCDGGTADYPTIQAAVHALDPASLHTIQVAGRCEEGVLIRDFLSLTIDGGAGMATVEASGGVAFFMLDSTVDLENLTITAPDGGAGVYASASDVEIRGSSVSATFEGVVAFSGASVRLGGPNPGDAVVLSDCELGAAVTGDASRLRFEGQVTVENNADAVAVTGGGATFQGRDIGNTIRNNNRGLLVTGVGVLGLSGLNDIDANGAYGIFALRGGQLGINSFSTTSNLPPYFGTTIRNHEVWGILSVGGNVLFGSSGDSLTHAILGNGSAPLTRDAGVYVIRPGETRLRNVTIADNLGPGVHATRGAYVNLLRATISGNSGHGMLLAWNSTGDLGSFDLEGDDVAPEVVVTGNRGDAIRCIQDSVLAGDRSGIAPIRCNTPGPPAASLGESGDGEARTSNAAIDLETTVLERVRALEARALDLERRLRRGADR